MVLPFQLAISNVAVDPSTEEQCSALFSVVLYDTTRFTFAKSSADIKRKYLLFKQFPLGPGAIEERMKFEPFYTPGPITASVAHTFDGMFGTGFKRILWSVSVETILY